MGGKNKIERGAKFQAVTTWSDEVRVTLANGVTLHVSSRVGQTTPGQWQGRLRLTVGNVQTDPGITISEQSSHSVCVNYPLSES